MGQKTHPVGFRLGVIRGWSSKWYSEKDFTKWLHEDLRLKKFVKQKLNHAGVSSVEVERAAENVATQLERRVAFRRAMKKAVQTAMKFGAKGIRLACAGRLGGAEMARYEWYREGRVPLHTLRADIEYGFAEANTTYGKIGVKCWIFKGEILPTARGVAAPSA